MHRSRNARENGITARTYANTRRRIRAHIKKLALSPSAPSVFSNVSVPSGAFGLSSSVSSGAFSSSVPSGAFGLSSSVSSGAFGLSSPPVFTFSFGYDSVPSVPSFSFQNGPSDPPVRPTVFGNGFGLSSSSSTFVPSFSFGSSSSSSSPAAPSFTFGSPAAPAASEEIKIIKPSSPGGEICFSRYSESCSELIHSSDDSDSDTWCSDTPMSPSSSSSAPPPPPPSSSSSPAFVSNTPLDDDQVKLHERYLAMRRNALTGPLPSDHLPGFLTPLVSCPAGQQEDILLFVNWYSGNFRSSPPPSPLSSRRLARIMSPSESCWDEAFVETVRSLSLSRRVCVLECLILSFWVCVSLSLSLCVCVCVHSPSSFSATTSSSGTSSSTNSTNSPNPVFAPSSPTPHQKPSTNSSKTHSPSYPPNHGTTTPPCSSSSATSPPNTSPTNSSSMHATLPLVRLFDSTLSLSCCVRAL